MKKKFLSLMMAAAVVATTSVSAFAAVNTTDVTGDETKEHNTEISITGDIEDQKGQVKPGTLSVTVPTAAAFRVDKTGHLEGAKLQVTNKGTQTVEVFVNEFVDVNGESGINVVSDTKTSLAPDASGSVDRKNVSLKISGNRGTAYLGTAQKASKKGVYEDNTLNTEAAGGIKVSEIDGSKSDTLNLTGEAGQNKAAINDAIRDDFTLKLMIRKKPITNSASGDSHTSSDIHNGDL